jgi:long-chain fatty acid transport protein
MKKEAKGLLVAALALGLLPAGVLATDGYFANGYGTPCKAMAGACVALHLTTLSPATNPAALGFLERRYDLGVEYFNPNRQYSVDGAPSGFPGTFGLATGTVESGSNSFVIPSLGGSWKAGENGTVGVAIYGNGGMNTDYAAPTFGDTPTGVDLSQVFIAPTYAFRLGSGHAIGVTGIVAYQRFKAEGLQAFAGFSQDPDGVSNNGYASSWGYGARIGYLGKITEYLSVGASYQTKLQMGKFGKYSGLFAESGGFDIPATWTAGVAVRPVFPLTVAVDVEQIFYSDVRSIGNAMLPNLMQARLGDSAGAGFCWRDTTTYKFGVQYEAGQDWTLRAGYSHGGQPVESDELLFNILAPGVIQNHAAVGLSRLLTPGKEVHLTVVRAFSNSVSGPNTLEAPNQQKIELKMDEWEYEIGFSFGF